MKFSREDLINELRIMTDGSTRKVHRFKELSPRQLNFKENPERWSILECIEHLNLYGDFYLPEIEKQILKKEPAPDAVLFKSGWIGNYFAKLMKVNNGKITKMKSPKDKNPSNSELTMTTLDRFLKQQDRLMALLRQAENADLTNTKCAISLTPFIKLRLGDTFRFLIYHIERHVYQAENVAKKLVHTDVEVD